MIEDKSQAKREQLQKKIIQLENQEDDLLTLKKRYEKQVMDFRTDFLALNAQIENLIDSLSDTNPTNHKILEENKTMQQDIDSYVEQELDNVSKKPRKFSKN